MGRFGRAPGPGLCVGSNGRFDAMSGKRGAREQRQRVTGACPSGAGIVDSVGYSGTCQLLRDRAEREDRQYPRRCASAEAAEDTGNNAADFMSGGPTPRNTASADQQRPVVAGVRENVGSSLAPGPLVPNPPPRRVQVYFTLPRAADVRVRVLDLQGRAVATSGRGAFTPGLHDARGNGLTTRGPAWQVGIYSVQLGRPGPARVVKKASDRALRGMRLWFAAPLTPSGAIRWVAARFFDARNVDREEDRAG